ncbi:MAG: tetratricopeptide repeat protein [Mariprofundus sp.]
MLAASDSAPNTRPQPAMHTPVPGNWHGVSDGMEKAIQLMRNGNLQQAEYTLKELLEFAPVEIRAWKLLARIQRQLGHIEEGIASATRALKLQNNAFNDEPPASVTLARLLWQQNEYDEAIRMLEVLMEKNPDDVELTELKTRWGMEEIV